jgi:hypothetical protein
MTKSMRACSRHNPSESFMLQDLAEVGGANEGCKGDGPDGERNGKPRGQHWESKSSRKQKRPGRAMGNGRGNHTTLVVPASQSNAPQ